MKRITPTALLGGILVLFLSGCISPPSAEFTPPEGLVFSNYKAPLLVDFDNTEATGYAGTASCGAFHDIILTGLAFAWGDCSIDTANQNGRLNRVGSADYEYLGFLRVFGKTTVHAYQAQSDNQ